MASYLPKSMTNTGRTVLKSTVVGGSLDLVDLDQGHIPPALPNFRFEPRRSRIDWRMLHGVDVNSIVRDLDLDTLEKVVSIVAYGDIEAEDTRHLTELNFVKIFRLSQLVVEYLLYVQDCLQSTNKWLQNDRSQLEKYTAAARLRLREMEVHYQTAKRELRRVRRTAKTYEIMVALGKVNPTADVVQGKSRDQLIAAAAAPATPALAAAAVAAKAEPLGPAITAMELVLRQELLLLADRLSRTQAECGALKQEREEMAGYVKEIDVAVRNKGLVLPSKTSAGVELELRAIKEQLTRAQSDYKMLRAEKDELVLHLEASQSHAKVLQGEKEALLQEMGRAPAMEATTAEGNGELGIAKSPLSGMLLEAEGRNKVLTERVSELQGQIGTLQKQLMKAMKDAASIPKPMSAIGPAQSEELSRALSTAESVKSELTTRVADLERELMDKRRAHDEDVRIMQEELLMYQQQSERLASQLEQYKNTSPVKGGGFIKVESKVASSSPPTASQLQYQLNNSQQECAELQAQVLELQSHNQRLSEGITAKDSLLSHAWDLIHELQAQLAVPSANRDPDAAGRVKAQVQEFERVAQAAAGALADTSMQQLPTINPAPRAASMLALSVAASDSSSVTGGGPPLGLIGPNNNASFKFSKPGRSGPNALVMAAAAARASADSSVATQNVPTPNLPRSGSGPLRPPGASPEGSRQGNRPSALQASVLKQEAMKHIAGMTPAQLSTLVEDELRVLTEHPYQYEDDDEQKFRTLLPYDAGGGALSAKRHTQQELSSNLPHMGPMILSQVDDVVASYGIDPGMAQLTDREYAAVMLELDARRNTALNRLDPLRRQQAEFMRDALFTHLELMKRRVEADVATAGPAAKNDHPRLMEPERRIGGIAAMTTPVVAMVGNEMEGGRLKVPPQILVDEDDADAVLGMGGPSGMYFGDKSDDRDVVRAVTTSTATTEPTLGRRSSSVDTRGVAGGSASGARASIGGILNPDGTIVPTRSTSVMMQPQVHQAQQHQQHVPEAALPPPVYQPQLAASLSSSRGHNAAEAQNAALKQIAEVPLGEHSTVAGVPQQQLYRHPSQNSSFASRQGASAGGYAVAADAPLMPHHGPGSPADSHHTSPLNQSMHSAAPSPLNQSSRSAAAGHSPLNQSLAHAAGTSPHNQSLTTSAPPTTALGAPLPFGQQSMSRNSALNATAAAVSTYPNSGSGPLNQSLGNQSGGRQSANTVPTVASPRNQSFNHRESSPARTGLNQSLGRPPIATSPFNQSLSSSPQHHQLPQQQLNQSLNRSQGGPQPQQLQNVLPLNQSLTQQGASRLSSGAGMIVGGGPGSMNQSLQRTGSAVGLNATTGRGPDSPARHMSSMRAGLAGASPMNMSIRSAGTVKASLRDYSTADFDDDDDDDEEDHEEYQQQRGRRPDRHHNERDEYAVGPEEANMVDPGLSGGPDLGPDSGVALGELMPVPGQGWQGNTPPQGTQPRMLETSPSRGDRTSSPSRLARVTGGADEPVAIQHPIPSWAQEGLVGDDDDDEWGVMPSKSIHNTVQPKRIQSHSQQAATQEAEWAAQRKAAVAAAAQQQQQQQGPTRLQPHLSGGWTDSPQQQNHTNRDGSMTGDSEGAGAYDVASVHSFHANDTAGSTQISAARATAAAGSAAARAMGAWGSPNTTARRTGASNLGATQGTTAPGWGMGIAGGGGSDGRWNETIQTITSTVVDEVQTFEQSIGRGQGGGTAWTTKNPTVAAAHAAGQAGTAMWRDVRRDSIDTVSEVEYA